MKLKPGTLVIVVDRYNSLPKDMKKYIGRVGKVVANVYEEHCELDITGDRFFYANQLTEVKPEDLEIVKLLYGYK